ncbi:MAG: tetratricopeptide repeat protein [Kofleriaceae bacterium]|nr:tetratricopeptide repeat protein [Kofleriaceae bacterium]
MFDWKRGKFEAANALMDESIGIRKKNYGTDLRGLAESLVNLAAVNFNTGNYAKASGLYEESLALLTEAVGPTHVDLAVIHEGIGLVAVTQKNLDKGLHHYSLAREILKSAGDQELRLSHLLLNTGYLEAELGDFLKSEAYFLRAQVLLEGKLGANHLQSAPILAGLGEANFQLKRYSKAKAYLQLSIALQTKAKSMPHVLATSQLLLAYTLWASNEDRREALRLAHEAKEVFEKYQHELLPEVTGWLVAHE